MYSRIPARKESVIRTNGMGAHLIMVQQFLVSLIKTRYKVIRLGILAPVFPVGKISFLHPSRFHLIFLPFYGSPLLTS